MNRIQSGVTLGIFVVLLSSLAVAGSNVKGFPLPSGAVETASEPGPDGNTLVYFNVSGNWQKVSGEIEKQLTQQGWKMDSKEVSPRYSRVTWIVSKKAMMKAQLEANGDASTLTLWVPSN